MGKTRSTHGSQRGWRRIKGDLPLVGYSTGNFGKNLLLSGFDTTFLFLLTDLLGVAPASASALMLIVFLGDLLFDIGAGYLASWARSRGLGYRSIITVGALPGGIAFAILYSFPALGTRSLFSLATALLVFRAAYAVIDVPHNTLLAGVAKDSRSRGRAAGYRLFFSSLASLTIALVLTPAVVKSAALSQGSRLSALGIGAGVLFCLTLWLAAWASDVDQVRGGPNDRPKIWMFPRFDRPFAAMLTLASVTGFAVPMFSRMVIYVSSYVLGQPEIASRILLAITIGQFSGVLLWTFLVRFAEKANLLCVGYLIVIFGISLFALVGRDPIVICAIAALIGVGLSAVFMLPWGILADLVDFAEFRHGERRETAAFASVLVTLKAGGALSVGTISLVMSLLGYVPGHAQTRVVFTGMETLAFGVPIVGGVVAIGVLLRLRVGHERHARVLRALGARSRN